MCENLDFFFFFFFLLRREILQQDHKEWLFLPLLFHLWSETNHHHGGNVLMQPRVTAQLWNCPWQKVGGTWSGTKRASASGRAGICCSCFQKHHTWEERAASVSTELEQSPCPFSLGLQQAQLGSTRSELQNADQRHLLFTKQDLAKASLQSDLCKQIILKHFKRYFDFYFFSTWNSTCQYAKQAKSI